MLSYTVQLVNSPRKEDSLTLELLEAINAKSDVTQRHLADRLGIALGLANSYLKRCVRKGLVKIHHAPANRYLYYLTPKGFAEKSRLAREYLSISFDFYRRASTSLNQIYIQCHQNGQDRILLCGISELTEIASLRALEHPIELVGIFAPGADLKRFINLPVWGSLPDASSFDACLLTALDHADLMHRSLKHDVENSKIFVPSILGIG